MPLSLVSLSCNFPDKKQQGKRKGKPSLLRGSIWEGKMEVGGFMPGVERVKFYRGTCTGILQWGRYMAECDKRKVVMRC